MSTKTLLEYHDLPRLMTLMTGDEKHSTSATSTLDVIWTLYDRVLDVDPDRCDDPDRDRFLVSKGHGPMAYYAVLAAKGFIPLEVLETFGSYHSPLGHHPDRNLIAGVEIASGSLGHGLPLAVGMSAALRARSRRGRVFVLMGDGELDEGSNHEAIAMAARMELGRLRAVVIDNHSSTFHWPGGIASRFEVEGWTSIVVDGRDHDAIEEGFSMGTHRRPHLVVAEV